MACIVYLIKSLNILNFQFLCLGLSTHTPISVRERSCRSLETPIIFQAYQTFFMVLVSGFLLHIHLLLKYESIS